MPRHAAAYHATQCRRIPCHAMPPHTMPRHAAAYAATARLEGPHPHLTPQRSERGRLPTLMHAGVEKSAEALRTKLDAQDAFTTKIVPFLQDGERPG
jgi:hypothetical protein